MKYKPLTNTNQLRIDSIYKIKQKHGANLGIFRYTNNTNKEVPPNMLVHGDKLEDFYFFDILNGTIGFVVHKDDFNFYVITKVDND